MGEGDAQADGLHDADADVLGFDDVVLLGDAAEAFGDPAGESVGSFGPEAEAELAVDFLEGDVGVDEPGVGAGGLEDGAGFGEFVVDVAGDFLEDVAAGDEAGGAAVFVDDDGDADFFLLEAAEEAVEGDAFGDEDGGEGRGGNGMGGIEEELADVEEADDVVELPAIQEEEVAAGLAGEGDGVGIVVVEVDADEVDARGHDVGGAEVLEVDDGLDHGEFVGVEDAFLAGDVEDGFEFLFGEGFAGGAEEVCELAAGAVEDGAEGEEDDFGGADGGGVEAGEEVDVDEAEILGADFAEEDEQDGDGGDGDEFAVVGDEAQGDGVANVGEGDVDEGIADEDGGEEAGGGGEEGAEALAGGGVLGGDAAQVDGVDGKIDGFGAGEEGGAGKENEEGSGKEKGGHGFLRTWGEGAKIAGFTFRIRNRGV